MPKAWQGCKCGSLNYKMQVVNGVYQLFCLKCKSIVSEYGTVNENDSLIALRHHNDCIRRYNAI